MAKWRRHTVEFKRQVVERMKTSENIHELARELNIQRKLLYTWKYQFEGRPEPRHANLATTAEERKDKHLRDEITKLKSALAEKAIENACPQARSLAVNHRRPRQQNRESHLLAENELRKALAHGRARRGCAHGNIDAAPSASRIDGNESAST